GGQRTAQELPRQGAAPQAARGACRQRRCEGACALGSGEPPGLSRRSSARRDEAAGSPLRPRSHRQPAYSVEGTVMLDIAIVEGVRTPFAKAYGPLASVPAQELGRVATTALLQRAGVRPDRIDQVVFGNVVTPADAANVARVIALLSGI